MRLTWITFAQRILVVTFLCVGSWAIAMSAYAADGSGSASVTPSSIEAGTTGNDIEVDYVASEDMADGGVRFQIPAEWENPQTTPGSAGYVTVMTTGLTGQTVDAIDSATGWADNSILVTESTDATDKIEGSGSVQIDVALGLGLGRVYKNYGTGQDWSGYSHAAFWMKSTSALSLGDVEFAISTNTGINGGTTSAFAIPAMPANTWTHVVVDFGSASRSSIRSFGLNVPLTLLASYNIDNLMLGPVDNWSISGDVITVPMMALESGDIVGLLYGGSGGASGFTAATVAGDDEVTVWSKDTIAGSYVEIADHPVVTTLPGEAVEVVIESKPEHLAVFEETETPFVVALYDEYGNLATNDSTTSIYLDAGPRPGASDVLGTNIKNVTNGVATFDDIYVNQPGDYYFIAFVSFTIQDVELDPVTAYGMMWDGNSPVPDPCYVTEGVWICDFRLYLSHEPTEELTVEVTTTSEDLDIVTSQIVIPTEDWANAIEPIIWAVDDLFVEEEEEAEVLMTITSEDERYDGAQYYPVPFYITSDDAHSVAVMKPSEIILEEDNTTPVTYQMWLTSEPTDDVVITMNYDTEQMDVVLDEITFTSEDWNTPQEISIYSVDDVIDESSSIFRDIVHTVTSEDENYDGYVIDDINVEIRDDD